MNSFNLGPEEVQEIAQLYRLGITQEEIELFRGQLANILESFQVLEGVDTKDISPTEHSGDLNSVMREDITSPPLESTDVLSNAPLQENDFFKVKAVLE
mgnify:CR=1 FL=1|tara:strand:- start:382 stop:678 length:297 start_codon:yes stop_codon:yes gene_type:complete